jgi:hypothetical protein
LAPELCIEALKVVCGENRGPSKLCGKLVACEDMILMLDDWEAFFLDLSAEPIKYLKIEDECLEKKAFFFTRGGPGQPRHNMNPERMGLRGSQVYYLDREAQVHSHSAVDQHDVGFPQEPNLATLNNYILRKPAIFTAWV